LNATALVLSDARSFCSVACHDSCLATDDKQNAPVAEHEDEDYDEIERDKIPDEVEQSGLLVLPDHIRVAYSVDDVACRENHGYVGYEKYDPCRYHCQVLCPTAEFVLAPDRMYNF